jgi:hypothetical protein
MLSTMNRLLGAGVVVLLLTACPIDPQPSEGSGSPFTSGSIAATVEGSEDFTVSQTIRDPSSGAIQGTLTYTGTCNLVKAELRFSYTRSGQTVTGEEVDGIDTHFKLGPLAPNDPHANSYLGEDKFTPDSVVFVISNEACV